MIAVCIVIIDACVNFVAYVRTTLTEPGISAMHRVNVSTPQIALDDVYCSGFESSLVDCQHADWSNHDCSNTELAAVTCVPVTYSTLDGTFLVTYIYIFSMFPSNLFHTGWYILNNLYIYLACFGTVWIQNSCVYLCQCF